MGDWNRMVFHQPEGPSRVALTGETTCSNEGKWLMCADDWASCGCRGTWPRKRKMKTGKKDSANCIAWNAAPARKQ